MDTAMLHSSILKAEARSLGFSACGVAAAGPVDEVTSGQLRQWLDDGRQAGMTYMTAHLDKRLNPQLLLPGARSVVSVALNYFPRQRLSSSQLQFAYYAYGRDYHDVMRTRLSLLLERLRQHAPQPAFEAKLCCDTVPMLDRYWAWRAGLGWIGKNTNLIIPRQGSFCFLGEIILTAPFDRYDRPQADGCGTCEQCLHACPTRALCRPRSLDARRCLSYLTIEHRGHIPSAFAHRLHPYIYGCDRCQLACPHNRHATPTSVDEFAPNAQFLSMSSSDWQNLTREQYQTLFRGSAVKRAKFDGLCRNIAAATHPEYGESKV